jgi:hypothetical protein
MAFCANFFGGLILCVLLNCRLGSYIFFVVVVCDRAFKPIMMVPNCDFLQRQHHEGRLDLSGKFFVDVVNVAMPFLMRVCSGCLWLMR